MLKIQVFLGKLLRRFPVLHAAVQAGYTQKLLQTKSVKTPFGFSFCGTAEMQAGDYERQESQIFLSMIKRYEIFVNIGANIGYYVCLARSRGLQVVAVEPDERNLKILIQNLRINDWLDLEIHPVAVGANSGLVPIYGGGAAASLLQGWAGSTQSQRYAPVHKIDNLLGDRFLGRKVFVLMDVEGFELPALQSARRFVKLTPAPTFWVEICIDDHQPKGRELNPNLKDTFKFFWEHGYTASMFAEPKTAIQPSMVESWAKGKNLPPTRQFFFEKPSK